MRIMKYFIVMVLVSIAAELSAMPPHPDIIEQYKKNGELKTLVNRVESMNSRLNMNSPLKAFPSSGERRVPVLLVKYVTPFEASGTIFQDVRNMDKGGIFLYGLLLVLFAYISLTIRRPGFADRRIHTSLITAYLFLFGFFISCGVSRDDDEDEIFPTASSVYSTFLNGNSLSVRKYYQDMSRNKLNLNFDIYGPVKVSKTWNYYGENDASGDDKHAAELVSEALRLMVSKYKSVDFRQYNNDGDGYIDAVIIIHEGPGEETGGGAGTIWSHQWDLASAGYGAVPTGDGVSFNVYTIQPEYTFLRGDSSMGVYVHEFAHVLGLPDLYDTGGNTNGVGNWSLMGEGSWMGPGGSNDGTTPAPLLAWERLKAGGAGWLTVTAITSDAAGQSIGNIDSTGTVYKVPLDSSPGKEQYLLIEGKVQSTTTQWYVSGTGVLITHIHEGVISAYTSSDAVNAGVARVHGVNIFEADGGGDLWDKGDKGTASDLFIAAKSISNANKYTDNTNYDITQVAPTGIAINNFSSSLLPMTFDVNFP